MRINRNLGFFQRKPIFIGLLLFLTLGSWIGLSIKNNYYTVDTENQLITEWYELFLEAERFSEGFRAPVASYIMGYIGMAAYETAVSSSSGSYRSLTTILPSYSPNEYCSPHPMHLLVSLNACYKIMFDRFYITAPSRLNEKAQSMFIKWESRLSAGKINQHALISSREYGFEVAKGVFEYSVSDINGHQPFLHNYDKHYIPPPGEGKWKVAEEFPMPAVLPHWGKVRPFIIKTNEFLAKPLPEFSYLPGSEYYTEALEVLTVSSPLSFENKWIAEYWSDDHPGLTFSPSGRWISITNQVIKKTQPPISKTLETYLKIGFALTDASIACWHSKYHYNLDRPESYIKKVFNNNWQPLFHSPPFPGYPSGHSIFGAVSSVILSQLYGTNYELEDKSHLGREEFMSKPRKFHSFYEMAFENAFSRISLGVHYRMDCEEGLRLGFIIGKKISDIQLKSPEYSLNDK